MPIKPAHPCGYPGCPALVLDGSRCPEHSTEAYKGRNKYRGTAASRGYDYAWTKLRNKILKRDGYLCQHCLVNDNRLVPAKDVDHIIRFNGPADPLRLNEKNLQSLCRECHSRKTVQVDGGFGNAKKVA